MHSNTNLKPKAFVLSAFASLCLAFTGANVAHAKPAKERIALQQEGITVWKVPVKNSNMLGFKAQAMVNADIQTVFGVVKDVQRSHEWVPNTREAKILTLDDAKGMGKFYFVIDMPFPLSDRDLLVQANFDFEPNGNILIRNTGIADKNVPPRKSLIRIKTYKGNWYLEKIAAKKTRVTLDGHANPEGGIPAWVANMFVTQQPFQMMRNLRKQVKKP